MHASSHNLIIYNGYPLSIVLAIVFHTLVLAAVFFWQSDNRTEVLNLIQPTVIKALIIDVNPQLRNTENLERARLQRIEQQQLRDREQQAELDRLREQERERAREQQAEQQRIEDRERAALIERQELDRQRAEQLQLDQEREQQREREFQQQLDRERQLEADRRRRSEVEDRQRQDATIAEAASTEFELVQSGTSLIQQAVQSTWSRPPSARNGMRAILRLEMLPTGEVTRVTITESSNDASFDRSAENAVYRAAPFTELRVLPINVFNANFRTLSLIFQPEDLLN